MGFCVTSGRGGTSFNTQPPEGGWGGLSEGYSAVCNRFNTQPPEGGWFRSDGGGFDFGYVSTHSRLKAAGHTGTEHKPTSNVSTHSRLKAAGFLKYQLDLVISLFQHTAA